jgi:hypothetical protein
MTGNRGDLDSGMFPSTGMRRPLETNVNTDLTRFEIIGGRILESDRFQRAIDSRNGLIRSAAAFTVAAYALTLGGIERLREEPLD